MTRASWRRGRHARRGGVAQVIATVLLVAMTVTLMIVIYLIKFPLPNPPPSITYAATTDAKFPVWGDPSDCYPVLPHNPNYYLGNGTGNATDQARWNTYMDAWTTDCDTGDNGTYNTMVAAQIIITGVSQQIPLSAITFQFICINNTPKYDKTYLVQGDLGDMEWVPGGSQNLSANAPLLGTCASYNPEGSGANSVYYNRLGFFDPLDTSIPVLMPGMTIVIYVHTADSIYEAPNPLFAESTWNLPDADDYHGAPLWCFTVPGSCMIQLIDTDWSSPVVILTAPVYLL